MVVPTVPLLSSPLDGMPVRIQQAVRSINDKLLLGCTPVSGVWACDFLTGFMDVVPNGIQYVWYHAGRKEKRITNVSPGIPAALLRSPLITS